MAVAAVPLLLLSLAAYAPQGQGQGDRFAWLPLEGKDAEITLVTGEKVLGNVRNASSNFMLVMTGPDAKTKGGVLGGNVIINPEQIVCWRPFVPNPK